MSSSLQNLLRETLKSPIIRNCNSKRVGTYVFGNAGKSLEEIAVGFSKSDIKPINMTSFASRYTTVISILITGDYHHFPKDKETQRLVAETNKIIIEAAEERNIRLDSNSREIYYPTHSLDQVPQIDRIVDLKNLSKDEKLRQCLKWIDLLTEFYTGDNIINHSKEIKSLKKIETLECLRSRLEKNSTSPATEDSVALSPEDLIVIDLIKQGYLQCDLK